MSNPLPLDDWGGSGPVLHFAHANGFPPAAYRKLIEVLKTRYHVVSLRTRCLVPGMTPDEVRGWEDLADDLIISLRAHGLKGIIGVGHSMGSVCTLLAHLASPGLFRSLVALDPVLFTGGRAWALRTAKLLGQSGRIPPASLARRRREYWSSREEVAESYRRKPLFQRWDAESFQDYLTHGFTETPEGGVRLTISKAWEVRLFETSPHGMWQQLRTLSVPTLVLRAEDSDTLSRAAFRRIQRTIPGVRTEELPDTGHLFPLEKPELCGQRILEFLSSESGALQGVERNEVAAPAPL
ncbi:MAG TPA: alpha/beta hydrolase [Myxococcaceae bacterium]|nr:alpha/beta hydrolase [Myxococcaceae bacterium]